MPLKEVILGQDLMVLTRMSSENAVPKEYSYRSKLMGKVEVCRQM